MRVGKAGELPLVLPARCFVLEPRRNCPCNPLPYGQRSQHSTVKQQGIRACQPERCLLYISDVLSQKKCDMAQDLRFCFIRQTELLESGPFILPRCDLSSDVGEKPVKDDPFDICSCQAVAQRTANNRAATTGDSQRHLRFQRVGKQVFFGRPTQMA